MTDLAVIMSVYKNDSLKFLRESVESILNQTFSAFHFYIAFDGHVSLEIEDYVTSLKDERIRLYRLEKNGGLAQALNYLLKIVLKNPFYRFIARMDADDISLPLRIGKQRDFLMLNPDISIVGCWYQEIDEAGKTLSNRRLPVEHEALKKRYYTRTPFAHPSVMFKRELIERVGYYPTDTILMEDNVLWGRALKSGLRFANIQEYLFQFRIDNMFFKRRSGIKYGWNFIRTKFKINYSLKFPASSYFFVFLVGSLKMLPSFLLMYVYLLAKRY